MEFYIDSAKVSFEQFSIEYPEESKILAPFDHPLIKIYGEKGQIALALEDGKSLKIEVEKTLSYHQKTFFKRSPYFENLAKALGIKNDRDKDLKVLDATSGLMSDSLMMVAIGLRNLTLSERHPLIQALILNSIKNSKELAGLQFLALDSSKIEGIFDVIYFDPMYSETNQKAASKKGMVFMRQLIGPDQDAQSTAEILLGKCKRLVIKRSQKARPILDGFHHQVLGKSTHYDIYFNNELKFGINS